MIKNPSARVRIIEAAAKLFYRKGYRASSFRDISRESKISLALIYYYYESKEEIAYDVIQLWADDINNQFDVWQRIKNPRSRLKALLRMHYQLSGEFSKYGCPIVGVSNDFMPEGAQISAEVVKLIRGLTAWCAKQFYLITRDEEKSKELAEYFLGSLKGSVLISVATRSEYPIMSHCEFLSRFLDSL